LLPRAILLDLDDTIIDDSGPVETCWDEACLACDSPDAAPELIAELKRVRDWYWSDAERHRVGRLDMRAARTHIVATALQRLGRPDDTLSVTIADRYTALRDVRTELIPGALDTLRWFRGSGCRLALLTNGASDAQRYKIARFDLAPLFDTICIEGELGFGKPDPRVFERALAALKVPPGDAWMIGDHLHWDVAAAQACGVYSVWIDSAGRGIPGGTTVRPDLIVRALRELQSAPANEGPEMLHT
jgi:putative hydrolase of the HAD superfamily